MWAVAGDGDGRAAARRRVSVRDVYKLFAIERGTGPRCVPSPTRRRERGRRTDERAGAATKRKTRTARGRRTSALNTHHSKLYINTPKKRTHTRPDARSRAARAAHERRRTHTQRRQRAGGSGAAQHPIQQATERRLYELGGAQRSAGAQKSAVQRRAPKPAGARSDTRRVDLTPTAQPRTRVTPHHG